MKHITTDWSDHNKKLENWEIPLSDSPLDIKEIRDWKIDFDNWTINNNTLSFP